MAGDQGIVQISDKEGTHVFATLLTIQDCETCFGAWLPNDPPDNAVITFTENSRRTAIPLFANGSIQAMLMAICLFIQRPRPQS